MPRRKPRWAEQVLLHQPPKEEPAPVKEEIQGNLYINHEYGFHMYKAPSWQIIEGAGQTLPNAIVAMGTSNESTLLVIGHETIKASAGIRRGNGGKAYARSVRKLPAAFGA